MVSVNIFTGVSNTLAGPFSLFEFDKEDDEERSLETEAELLLSVELVFVSDDFFVLDDDESDDDDVLVDEELDASTLNIAETA